MEDKRQLNFSPQENIFLKDYLMNLIAGDAKKPFISSAFIHWTKQLMHFGFTVLDLPISISDKEQYPHLVESDGHRGIIIKAGGEAILFKKEIKEGRYNLKKDLIITHKY